MGWKGQDVTHEIHEELIIKEADCTNMFVFSLRNQRSVLSEGEQLKVFVAGGVTIRGSCRTRKCAVKWAL